MTRVAVCDRRQVMTLFDLIERLGVAFAPRQGMEDSKMPIREIVRLIPRLLAIWECAANYARIQPAPDAKG